MFSAAVFSASDIDAAALAQCAAEPIHIPGTIQPRGILLALDTNCDTVLVASANASSHFQRPLEDILGRSASSVLGSDLAVRVRSLVGTARDGLIMPIPSIAPAPRHAVLAHRHDGRVIVEIIDESTEWVPDVALASVMVAVAHAQRSPADPAALTSGVRAVFERRVATLDLDPGLASLCDRTATEVRKFTGYDRVMVYQFDDDGHGAVIAEARRDDLEPFLGLHYPASDIPAQARALYLQTRVRVLEGASHVPVPLLAADSAAAGRPLDLSAALLRSMSPIHLQYLRNMGVEATLVASIVVDDRLWGLIACHHMSAKWPSFSMRAACDVLSEFVSVEVAVQENFARARARADANAAQADLMRRLAASGGRLDSALGELMTMISCGGIAIVTDGEVHRAGSAPTAERVRDLAVWCQARPRVGHTVAVSNLSAVEPAFHDMVDVASGVLALDLGAPVDGQLLWFRPEQAVTVRWAGAPGKVSTDADGVPRLSPRGSFAEWLDERRAHATAFSDDELIIAEAIRSATMEIALELLEERRRVARLEYVRVRSAVDAASDGMAITDPGGRAIYVNAMFTVLTGFLVSDTTDPRELFEATPAINGIEDAHDFVAISGTGERVPVSLRIDTISDDAGDDAGTMLLITDQRPRQALAAERQRHARRLAEAQRMESLGIMAGGVAHDFNNLLTTISGNAALAHAELPPSSAVQESLAAIDLAVDHAAGLCRQLLSYAGKGHTVLRSVDVNALLGDLMRLLRSSLDKAHTVSSQLAENLPPINGDRTQLRQVLMNILINANEAIGGRGGRIEIATSCINADRATLDGFSRGETLPVGQYVEVRVSDSGLGMDQETMSRIFDPFFSTKFAGRGLGLAAALGVAHGHGGVIRVASRLGVGTTFVLLLPVAREATPVATEPPAPGRSLQAGAERRVLLVDDDAVVRETVCRLLEGRGFRVVQAANGEVALALVRAEPDAFSLVVSDIAMPVMDGATLLRTLRGRDNAIPVLLFSGYSPDGVSAMIAHDRHTRFVQKPFSMDVLASAIAELLGTGAA